VKAASAAFGGAVAASATVIVAPDVLFDAVELPELLPPQAASARAAAAATVVVRLRRPRVLLSVLANVPLSFVTPPSRGSGTGAVSWHVHSRLRDQVLICV